jgi:hypothetical protein
MDFRDQVLFRLVRTGADGHALVAFDLSDDLTSWRVTGTAMTRRLQVGEGSTLVPVGLPFFVEMVVAPEYLSSDQVAIRLRTYGSGLAEGDRIRLEVSAPSLGMEPIALTAQAFDETIVPMPALSVGRHPITVDAERMGAGDGGARLADRLTRSITVIPSRLTRLRTTISDLDEMRSGGGSGIHSYVVTDTGRGATIGVLLELASPDGLRADQVIGAAEARRLLTEVFGVDPDSLPSSPLDRTQFQAPRGGIALLPYARPEVTLSALVGLTAPGSVDRDALLAWLQGQRYGAEDDRDEMPPVLAGLAGLGDPVAAEVRALAAEAWGIDGLLWLGLAAAASGDDATALDLERRALARAGEQQEPYLRLVSPAGRPNGELTARLALLAAWVNDLDTADAALRWITDDPPADTVMPLERLGIALHRAEHLPATVGRFAVTVDGERSEVTLDPGASWSVRLVPAQAASLRLEPIEGSLRLVSTWLEPMDPTSLPDDPAIRVTRRATPAGPVASGEEVQVRIRVELTPDALPGCHLVTDLAPSGLAPIAARRSWRDRDEPGVILPWRIDGQRVTFCVERDADRPVQTLRYAARVVTPGTYTWEPTVVQSSEAPGVMELGEATSIELR